MAGEAASVREHRAQVGVDARPQGRLGRRVAAPPKDAAPAAVVPSREADKDVPHEPVAKDGAQREQHVLGTRQEGVRRRQREAEQARDNSGDIAVWHLEAALRCLPTLASCELSRRRKQ